MTGRARHVEVVIDELVLHGFDPRHRERIAEAVRAELAATLQGWSGVEESSVARVDAGSFTVPAAAPPDAVGRRTARLVSQVLQGSGKQAEPRRPDPPGRSS